MNKNIAVISSVLHMDWYLGGGGHLSKYIMIYVWVDHEYVNNPPSPIIDLSMDFHCYYCWPGVDQSVVKCY